MRLTIEQAKIYFDSIQCKEVLFEDSNQSNYNPLALCKYSVRLNKIVVTLTPKHIYLLSDTTTICLNSIDSIELYTSNEPYRATLKVVCGGALKGCEYIFKLEFSEN